MTHHYLRKYAPLLLGVPLCLAAGWFELTRALGGREVAWVYAFEWPAYAVAGAAMWWRIWHRDPVATNDSPVPLDDDPELVAWQNYLSDLEAVDPPGTPPSREKSRRSEQRPQQRIDGNG